MATPIPGSWTSFDEERVIRGTVAGESAATIADRTRKTVGAVKQKRRRLRRAGRLEAARSQKWTDAELAKLHPFKTAPAEEQELRRLLPDRTPDAARAQLYRLRRAAQASASER
ncbi:hypothetical protein Q5424_00890 [Conexibacter sp. JD483]|uniref:hypothetical protein n=1 Tax=unclassified Conexibacter TaxID=2627773 RepID=UPI00272405C4|nr:MULTISPECIES: hypothetical protein [unclassified Conexibacter]MDO8189032.1 hypothetical protein [Conexibacter sp. CPCC 205706]MDO8198527.1 hypothetical protein [Conexibacter sp. CPCC 205762]MDR9367613.1 hypothetical protein [Conexibacter sp. JD483]